MKKSIKFLFVLGAILFTVLFVAPNAKTNTLFADDDPQVGEIQFNEPIDDIVKGEPEEGKEETIYPVEDDHLLPSEGIDVIIEDVPVSEEPETEPTPDVDIYLEQQTTLPQDKEENPIEEAVPAIVEIDASGEISKGETSFDGNIFKEYVYTEEIIVPSFQVKIDNALGYESDIDVAYEIDSEATIWSLFGVYKEHVVHDTSENEGTDLKITNKGNGTWVIDTDDMLYRVERDQTGWFIVPIYKTTEKIDDEYNVIRYNITVKSMDVKTNFDNNDDGIMDGLQLKTKEITLTAGSDLEAVVFDGQNVSDYIYGYKWAYECEQTLLGKGKEELSITNIDFYAKDGSGNVLSREEVCELFDISIDGKDVVSINAKNSDKAGDYTVYLEGLYTEELYEYKNKYNNKLAILPTITYTGDYKLVNVPGHFEGKKWVKAHTDIYKIEDHSGWATFAEILLRIVDNGSDIEIPTGVDGYKEWVTIETKGNEAIDNFQNTYVMENGKVVGVYEINLYEQVEGQPVNKIDSFEAGEENKNGKAIITLTVTADVPDGQYPVFTVYHLHDGVLVPDTFTIDPENIIDNGDGTYTITFEQSYFSDFGVAYNTYPIPVHHSSSSDGYQFVNTGVSEVVETVDYTGYVSLVAGLALVAIALRKRLAD